MAESSNEGCAREGNPRKDITFASASGPHCILAVDFLAMFLRCWVVEKARVKVNGAVRVDEVLLSLLVRKVVVGGR